MRFSYVARIALVGVLTASTSCKAKRPGVGSLRRGQELLASQPSAAIREYERARSEGADSIEVKKGLAAAHEKLSALDDAERFLREVTAQQPRDADARFALARILLRKNQFDSARNEVAAVLESEPPHPASILTYAALATAPNQVSDGLRALDRLKVSDGAGWSQSCEYVFGHAALLVAKGDIAGSESILGGATTVTCQSPVLTLMLATISSVGRRPRLAEWLLTRATDSDGAPEAVHEALAELALAQRHVPLAKRAISRLRIGADPDLKALLLLTQLHDLERNRAESANAARRALEAVPLNDDAERRRVTMVRATALARAGNAKKAAEQLIALLEKYPGFPPAMLLLANLHLHLREPEAAAALGQKLIEHKEMMAAGYQVLVSAQVAKNDPSEAEAMARRFAKASGSADSVVLLANVLVRNKRTDAALREVEAGCRRHPEHFELLRAHIALGEQVKGFSAAEKIAREAVGAKTLPIMRELARLCERHGRLDEALGIYREMVPSESRALLEVSQVLDRMGRSDESLAAVRELVKIAPLDVNAQVRLGLLEERSGSSKAARDAYEAALTIEPNSAIALNNLAMLLLGQLDEPARGLALARKAHAIAGDDVRIVDTLGWGLARIGGVVERDESVRLLWRSSRGLKTAEGYFHYAVALFGADRRREAGEELERALGLLGSTESSWRSEAEKLREQLKQGSAGSAPGASVR